MSVGAGSAKNFAPDPVRILILNQYFPPDPAPTGVLFAELAEALRQRGHDVLLAGAGEAYRAGQGRGMRLLREMFALVKIFWHGIFCKRVQVVVSGSSPPCLAVVAGLVALRHWAPHLHWAMDLYPEIAVALREVKAGIVTKLIGWFMKIAYRHARAVVALDPDMTEVLRRYGVHPVECRPWVPAPVLGRLPLKPVEPFEPWTWLYSGNLGRAHDWQTLLAAQAVLEERGVDATLVFQGGGPSRAAAMERAKELNLQKVIWRPYAAETDLGQALLRVQCLIVTQLPEAAGLLWPSKLALLLGLPRPLLFVGPKNRAIAASLRDRPATAVMNPGDFRAVADWITRLRAEPATISQKAVVDIAAHRWNAIAWWVDLIESAARK